MFSGCTRIRVQNRLRYQEAVASLRRVQEEWGPALGLDVSIGSTPRTVSSGPTSSLDNTIEDTLAVTDTTVTARGYAQDEV